MAHNKNNKGQSTLEFIMAFSASVGFIFLFLKMALNYTNGFMVHHATYMAARSYMVNDTNRDNVNDGDSAAFAKAKSVFTTYLPENFITGISAGDLQENSPEPSNTKYHAFVGVYVNYVEKFSMGFVGGKEPIRLRSEAFLGREPTRAEARYQACEAIKSLGISKCNVHVTLEDNGG